MTTIDFVAIGGSLGVLSLVVALTVRRRLKPRYALLWLAAATALVGVSVWRDAIDLLGAALGIDYKPVVVFLGIDLFVLLVLLHLSLVASRVTDQVRTLAQEVALLRHALSQSGGGDLPERGSDTRNDFPPPTAGANLPESP